MEDGGKKDERKERKGKKMDDHVREEENTESQFEAQ